MHNGDAGTEMRSRFNTNDGTGLSCVSPLFGVMILCLCPPSFGQDDGDDDTAVPFRPGLVAEYSVGDASLRQVVSTASVDDIPSGMVVRWIGRLFVRYDNRFEIRPYGRGDVTVKINSKLVITGQQTTAGWYQPATIELEYGWHPVEIVYRSAGDKSRFGMYWSCDQFLLEPITAWVHQPSDEDSQVDWEEGRRHVRSLGCVNCHEIPNVDVLG